MTVFNASPFATVPKKLIPGIPAYLFGSFPSTKASTKIAINAVASTSTVLTYYFTIVEGDIPVSPYGVLTAYGLATDPQFNVTNSAITASSVSVTAATGVGTLTVTGSGYNVYSKTADGGTGLIPQPEVGDTVANGQSQAVGLPYTVPWDAGQGPEYLECEVNFPTLPTACVVALQVAMTNTPATQWQTAITNVVTVSGGVATYGTTQWNGKANFARYSISGTSGSGTIVAKLCS
jgi:hypothetical protein